MKVIRVYDTEAKYIEKLVDKYNTTEAEIIASILDNLTDEEIESML
jgi:hypothetical protein